MQILSTKEIRNTNDKEFFFAVAWSKQCNYNKIIKKAHKFMQKEIGKWSFISCSNCASGLLVKSFNRKKIVFVRRCLLLIHILHWRQMIFTHVTRSIISPYFAYVLHKYVTIPHSIFPVSQYSRTFSTINNSKNTVRDFLVSFL